MSDTRETGPFDFASVDPELLDPLELGFLENTQHIGGAIAEMQANSRLLDRSTPRPLTRFPASPPTPTRP